MSDDGTRVRDQQGISTDGHTPLPWRVGDRAPYVEIWGCMRMNSYPIVASMESDPRGANAALIVEAVNSHSSLLEERERLKEALEKLTKAGNKVALKGAETGPQWLDLTMALLSAKATLSSISSGKQGDAAS
jgi:hypothetical protein